MAAAAAVVGIGGALLSANERIKAAKVRNEQLGAQFNQERTAEAKRSVDRLDRLNSIVSSNVASAGAHNVSPSSSTFKAINESSYNKFDMDENADLLNLKAREEYITQTQGLNTEEAYINAFSSLTSLGTSYFSQSKSSSGSSQ